MDKPPEAELPAWSDTENMPLIIIENSSVVEKPKTTDGLLPIGSEILLPRSPEMARFEDQDTLSAPLSPNRVREGHSQDIPAEGSIFDVLSGLPGLPQPPPSTYVNFNDPFFGAPIAFAQCHNAPGMDTPMTLPIYNIPKDGNIGSDQSAVPTVFTSGVSPDSIKWSTAEDIIRDIVKEGPFDAGARQSFDQYGYARLPVPNDIVHGDSTGGCGRNVWATAPPPPISGVHWSSGVGEIIECAMAAAVNLQRDAGLMMSKLPILAQFVTSLHRMSLEMMSIGVDHVVFLVEEVEKLSMIPRAQRAAKYMTAMGLWRPPSRLGDPGRLPVSTCPSCMKCEYCFGRREPVTIL